MNNFNAFEIRYNGGLNIDEIDNPHSKSDAINDYDIAYTPGVKRLTLINKEDQTLNDQVIFSNLATLTDVSNATGAEYDISYDTTNLKLFENGVLKDTENLTEKQELKIVGQNQGFRLVNSDNKSYIEVAENQSTNSGGNLYIGRYETASNPTARFNTADRVNHLYENVIVASDANQANENGIQFFKNSNEFFIQPTADAINKPIRFANSFKSTYDTNTTQYLGDIDINNNDISNVNNIYTTQIDIGNRNVNDDGTRLEVDNANKIAYLSDIHSAPSKRIQKYQIKLPFGDDPNSFSAPYNVMDDCFLPMMTDVNNKIVGFTITMPLEVNVPDTVSYKFNFNFGMAETTSIVGSYSPDPWGTINPFAPRGGQGPYNPNKGDYTYNMRKLWMNGDSDFWLNLMIHANFDVTQSLFWIAPYYQEIDSSGNPSGNLKPFYYQRDISNPINSKFGRDEILGKFVNYQSRKYPTGIEILVKKAAVDYDAWGKTIFVAPWCYYWGNSWCPPDKSFFGFVLQQSTMELEILNVGSTELLHDVSFNESDYDFSTFDKPQNDLSFITIDVSENYFDSRFTLRPHFYHKKRSDDVSFQDVNNTETLFHQHFNLNKNYHSIKYTAENTSSTRSLSIPNIPSGIKMTNIIDLGISVKPISGVVGTDDLQFVITTTDGSQNIFDFSLCNFVYDEHKHNWLPFNRLNVDYSGFENNNNDISAIDFQWTTNMTFVFDELRLCYRDPSTNQFFSRFHYFSDSNTSVSKIIPEEIIANTGNNLSLADNTNYGSTIDPSNHSLSIDFFADYNSGFDGSFTPMCLTQIRSTYADNTTGDVSKQGQGKLSFRVHPNSSDFPTGLVEKMNIQPNKVQLLTDLDLSGNNINNGGNVEGNVIYGGDKANNKRVILKSVGVDPYIDSETQFLSFGRDGTNRTLFLDLNNEVLNMNGNNISNVGALNMASSGDIDMNNGDINSINTAIITNKLGIKISNPERALHIRGDIPRIDRDSTVAFILAKYNDGTNYTSIQKSFIFGVEGGVSSFNDGYFFIGDYGTSVGGNFNERFKIENNGVVSILDNDLNMNSNDISNVGQVNADTLQTGTRNANNADLQLSRTGQLSLPANSSDWDDQVGKGLFFRYSTRQNQDEGYIQCIDRSTEIRYPLEFDSSSYKFRGGNSNFDDNNINNVGGINMTSGGDIDMNGGDINDLETLNSKVIRAINGTTRSLILPPADPSMEFSLINNTNSQPNNFINGASITIGRANNGLHIGCDGVSNNRRAYIQVGHESGNFTSSSGNLFLQPFGGTASGIKIGNTTDPTEKLDIEGNITMNGNNINNVGALNMSSSGDINMNSGDISNVSVINMSNAADINNVNDLNFNSLGTINTVNRINFSGVGANITTGTGDTLNITDPTISNSRLLITGTKSTFNTNISINDNEIQNFRMGYLLVNNDISLTNQYTVIDCDNSNNAMTVQLPTKTNGKIFKIMIRFEGTGNDVTLTASGGELFYTNVDPTGTSQLVLDDQHSNNTKTIKSIELVGFRLGWMVLRQDAT